MTAARAGSMTLCMHTNTSSGAGYRGALEGWAKAGIKYVEINAGLVDEFLKTDTIEGAKKVLSDNGLTPVHGTVGQFGLIEPNDKHAAAVEQLKKRLEMFAVLGIRKVYTTTIGGPKPALEDYSKIADQLRAVGDAAKSFDAIFSIECVRASNYMPRSTVRRERWKRVRNIWVLEVLGVQRPAIGANVVVTGTSFAGTRTRWKAALSITPSMKALIR